MPRAGPFVRLSLLSLLRSPLPALHLLLSANIWLRIGAQGARAPQVQPGGGSVHCVLALTAFVCAPARGLALTLGWARVHTGLHTC